MNKGIAGSKVASTDDAPAGKPLMIFATEERLFSNSDFDDTLNLGSFGCNDRVNSCCIHNEVAWKYISNILHPAWSINQGRAWEAFVDYHKSLIERVSLASLKPPPLPIVSVSPDLEQAVNGSGLHRHVVLAQNTG